MFLIISKGVDKNTPFDLNWHKSLLLQMAKGNDKRAAVITEKTKDELSKYLIFRHFYRHSYSSHLKWDELKKLVVSLGNVWENFKSEILNFIKNFETRPSKNQKK